MITYYVLKTESNYKIVNSTTHEIDSEGKLVKRKEPIFIMCRPLVSWDHEELKEIAVNLKPGEYELIGTI